MSQKSDRIEQVLEYCKPHMKMMWASSVVGILLNCDFKDAETELKKRNERKNKNEILHRDDKLTGK